MSTIRYRRDIDGLRSLAILPVVFNHAGIPGFPGGFVGVDIFFVVSGFLITSILMREIDEMRYSIVRFYERRARRILPALFALLLTCLVGGWFLLSPARYEGLGKAILATLFFVSNFWFLHAGDYFGPSVEFETLLHTWSLAVEEQFYVIYPLLLWALSGRPRRAWIATVAALSLVSLALSAYATTGHPTFSFYMLPTRFWELGAGALLALGAFPASRLKWVHEVAGGIGLALIAGAVLLINDETPFPGIAALAPVAGAVFLVFAGSGPGSRASRLLALPPFVGIGLISYSLYLWHWPIIVAARTITHSGTLAPGTAALCIALAMGLATMSLQGIERPFRQNRGKSPVSARGVLAFSVLGVALLGMSGSFLIRNKGIGRRFPQDRVAAYGRATRRSRQDKACMDLPEARLPCRIGASEGSAGPAHIAIWGDSHVGAMLSGFDEWAASRGESMLAFARSGCLPLLGVQRADLSTNHDCDLRNRAVMARIEADPEIDTVILAGRWAQNVEGVRAPNEGGKAALLRESGKPARGIAQNAGLVSAGLDRLVARLRARGISVVIIAGIPEIGRDVPDLVLAYGSGRALSGLVPDRAAYEARNRRTEAILEGVSTRYGAELIEPADILCPRDCRVEVEGEPLYRDDDHLSDFGARWLLPQLMGRAPNASPDREEPGLDSRGAALLHN